MTGKPDGEAAPVTGGRAAVFLASGGAGFVDGIQLFVGGGPAQV